MQIYKAHKNKQSLGNDFKVAVTPQILLQYLYEAGCRSIIRYLQL